MAEEKIQELAVDQAVTATRVKTLEETLLASHSEDIKGIMTELKEIRTENTNNYKTLEERQRQLELKMVEHDKAGSKDAKWLSGVGTSGVSLAVMIIVAVVNGWI